MASENYLDLVNVAINDVFGCQIRYDTGGMVIDPIIGEFTDESIEIGGDGGIITTAPMLMIRNHDLPKDVIPKKGHTVTIEQETYEVDEIKKDQSEAWLLALKLIGRLYA